MRFARTLLLVCLALTAVGLAPSRSSLAQEPSAPYLYYESTTQHAVIVERADGTDSHALGGITMPADHRIVIGPQFSYDHQWVAWTSRGGSGGDAKLYVVRVDGTAQVSQVEGLNRVDKLVWSPINNYIAIIRATRAGNSNGAETEYEILLVDTQFGDIITRQVQSTETIYETAWSSDGETFSVYYSVDPDNDYTTPELYKRLDMTLGDDFSRTDVTPTDCERPNYVFPNATVNLADHQLMLADGTALDLPTGYFQWLHFSPDGQQLLVWMRDECTVDSSEAEYHVWYARVDAPEFQEVISNAVMENTSSHYSPSNEPSLLWSTDSQVVALAARDGLVYLVNTASLSMTTVPMPPDFDPAGATFQWLADGRLYLQNSLYADAIYELVAGATEFTKDPYPSDYPDTAKFSANGRYMALSGDCPAASDLIYGATCVVDRQTDTIAVIDAHSGMGMLGSDYKDIYWQASADWLLIGSLGGAGGGEEFIQVANATGTIRRELTHCPFNQCFGWLPAEVVVETIPPIETRPSIPMMTLRGMQDYTIKAEWNPAGTQIAVSSAEGTTRIFDAVSGQLTTSVAGHVFDWSPDGATLATITRVTPDDSSYPAMAAGEGPIVIYDAATGQVLSTLEGQYFNLDFSPDGSYLAAGSQNGDVAIIDVASGETLYTTKFSDIVATVAFSPDGQRLAIGGLGNAVWVWDFASSTPAQVYTFDNSNIYLYGIFALEWRPDGAQLMGSGGPSMWFYGDSAVIFDLASGASTIIPSASYVGYSPDGLYRAQVNEYNGTLRIVGADDGEVAYQIYVSGWWTDFDPSFSRVLVAEPYSVTIWQLP